MVSIMLFNKIQSCYLILLIKLAMARLYCITVYSDWNSSMIFMVCPSAAIGIYYTESDLISTCEMLKFNA